jgi:hypothetical protein
MRMHVLTSSKPAADIDVSPWQNQEQKENIQSRDGLECATPIIGRFAARMSAPGVSDERIQRSLVGAADDAFRCGLDPEAIAEIEFELLKDFSRPRFRLERRQLDLEPSDTLDRRYVLASVAVVAIAVWIIVRPTIGSRPHDREQRRTRHSH